MSALNIKINLWSKLVNIINIDFSDWWCPRTDSNRGPIDYKSKSLWNFPFINVDIINFWNPRQASLNYSLTFHLPLKNKS